MKKAVIPFVLIFFTITNCNNQESVENQQKDRQQTVDNFEKKKLAEKEAGIILESLFKDNELIMNQLSVLRHAIETKNVIKSVEEIEKVLQMRDSLMKLLNSETKLDEFMEKEDGLRVEKELNNLGMQSVWAEGLYFGLEQAAILENIIEKVANEPYILKNKIENLYASSKGSEYPYIDILEEMQIVPLAEKLLTKYPGHKYNKEIAQILNQALMPLVDVHKVGTGNPWYIVGNYDVNEYPGVTNINSHIEFVKTEEPSKYAEIVNKIVHSISTLELDKFKTIYFVEVPDLIDADPVFANETLNLQLKELPDEIEEMDSWFKYLWLGVDIAHTLYLRNGDDTKSVFVYRFFDKKEAAEKSLKVIRKVIPSAKLVEYQLTEADNKHKN